MAIPDELKNDASKIAVDDAVDTDAYWSNVFNRAANAVVESTDPTHQFRGGLGDQPSYREVHDLVVAWQPEKQILQTVFSAAGPFSFSAVRRVLQAAEWSTLTTVDETVAKLLETRNAQALVAQAESLGTIMAEEGAPADVKRRVPSLTDRMWRALEPDVQQELIDYVKFADGSGLPEAVTPEAIADAELSVGGPLETDVLVAGAIRERRCTNSEESGWHRRVRAGCARIRELNHLRLTR